MLFVTWVKKMITWEIIREAEKTVKDIDSDSKYLEFCSFCNANFELFDAISCERVKKVIEETPIKLPVKVGSEGRLFGSINTKQIVDAFLKETGRQLNKQNIKLDKNINALGTYSIPIDLYKGIKANITLYVIEKE